MLALVNGIRTHDLGDARCNALPTQSTEQFEATRLGQLEIGEGFDVWPGQQEYLYQNEWTPTEQDLKLLYNRGKDESNKDFSNFVFSPRPSQVSCGKENCFFEDGSILYL
ncbi:uncharacterized protein [Montipora capricornis]|uniref:uncharacterized protein isoform X2 n=1 Tax=Montipora capricornis TaxID=246305 RepID=UPI0035F1F7A1